MKKKSGIILSALPLLTLGLCLISIYFIRKWSKWK